MDKAAQRLAQAIIAKSENSSRVSAIMMSMARPASALLLRYWQACGQDMRAYIPDRHERGLRAE